MKIGVIGVGSIGERHMLNIANLGHIVAPYDPQYRPEQELAFLWRDSDAVIIASPTPSHFNYICHATRLGKPMFVEKPIVDRHEHGTAISALPSSILMVGYNLRFHACVKKTKEWIDAGRIGKPIWANFTCGQFNSKPAYLRDGVVLNWSHEIDLALHLLGPGHLEASSVRIVDEHDDMADILLTHENGCRSTIHLDYITKPEQRHFTIQGDEGRITCTLPARHLFLLTQDKDQADWFHGQGSYDTDYIDEMKAFIDRIEGKETPGCSGEEALKVLEICLQVRKQAGMIS